MGSLQITSEELKPQIVILTKRNMFNTNEEKYLNFNRWTKSSSFSHINRSFEGTLIMSRVGME